MKEQVKPLRRIYLTPGDYKNIKITTPEDLLVAEAFAVEK